MYDLKRINSYKDIKQLYNQCFGIDHSIDRIKRKYDTQMFGLKDIGFIAYKEAPAAYYGVFPITLYYHGKDYLVAQSGDTMTAPEHRNKGLFIQLAINTYILAAYEKIKLVFGFPNKQSYPGFKDKLGWKFYGYMQRFEFNVLTIPFCELASKFPVLKSWYKRFVKNTLSNYVVDKADFAHSKAYIKKDANFIDYKLKGENVYLISFYGVGMLIKADKHLYIGEVTHPTLPDPMYCDMLLTRVKLLAHKLGCKKIIFTVSKNHWLYNILSTEKKPKRSLPIGFYIIDKNIDPSVIQFTHADFDTF